MARNTKYGCTFLAVAGIVMATLGVARPAGAQGGVTTPGPVFGDIGTRLIPFERAMVSDFRPAPSRPTDPQTLLIDSIDWARGTFNGSVSLWMDFSSGPLRVGRLRATTGQIRPLSDGYEVTFVARKTLEQTNFAGRLAPSELVINGVRQWVLEGQYSYWRSPLLCRVGEPCGTIGPFPCRLQGWAK